jgi:hypothetical protein
LIVPVPVADGAEKVVTAPTAVIAVALLLALFGSDAVVDTVAVFETVVPAGFVVATVIENVPEAPLANAPFVHMIVPDAPTAGATHANPPAAL